ncbi:MAG: hypothetical protein P0Y49_11755 [Candidatus Pedobacter colombiensis]|uniref:Uncharacterized protein n=1 Tax=Candidatus Pedobacter colombiensis TaxID=3121371 RepID=A0AAJ5W5F8_9SPHI|nr:hypothetical protein [Pedobacter sp.]WEK17470.1 MAG: hypothetical protein P0Y49_11755 [Pedobacter sp.]
MNINLLFRSIVTVLLIIWLPIGSFASNRTTISAISDSSFYQDKRDKKQENKKPEVKEVPQSRKQEKPGEVKQPDKKEKPDQDNKRKNN